MGRSPAPGGWGVPLWEGVEGVSGVEGLPGGREPVSEWGGGTTWSKGTPDLGAAWGDPSQRGRGASPGWGCVCVGVQLRDPRGEGLRGSVGNDPRRSSRSVWRVPRGDPASPVASLPPLGSRQVAGVVASGAACPFPPEAAFESARSAPCRPPSASQSAARGRHQPARSRALIGRSGSDWAGRGGGGVVRTRQYSYNVAARGLDRHTPAPPRGRSPPSPCPAPPRPGSGPDRDPHGAAEPGAPRPGPQPPADYRCPRGEEGKGSGDLSGPGVPGRCSGDPLTCQRGVRARLRSYLARPGPARLCDAVGGRAERWGPAEQRGGPRGSGRGAAAAAGRAGASRRAQPLRQDSAAGGD